MYQVRKQVHNVWLQVNIMTNMAEMAVRRVEEAWAARQMVARPYERYARALYAYLTPILFVDTGVYPWCITYCNAAAGAITGAHPCTTPW